MKKPDHQRIIGFDFIRFLATLCIITFHFMINGRHIYPTKYIFGNYDLAQVGVSLFFVLSGAALYYNHRESFSCRKYYKKRFLTIFPLFYVAYVGIFLFHFWQEGHIMTIPTQNLVFSVIGMDGLLGYKIPCLSLTGEWFLGAIIILYIIYPLLRKCVLRKPRLTLIFVGALYISFYYNYSFEMPILYNPLIRLTEFIFGMVYIEELYRKEKMFSVKISFSTFIISFSTALMMLYAKLPIPQMFEITIGGCSLFVTMLEFSKLIKNQNIVDLLKLSTKYSFAIFLVHHYIANSVQNHFLGYSLTKLEIVCTYVIYLLLVMVFAKMLLYVTNKILTKIGSLTENKNKK